MGLLSQAKADSKILLEGVIVGFLLVVLYFTLALLFGKNYTTLFIAGALFHILCEMSGLNKWYVENYYK